MSIITANVNRQKNNIIFIAIKYLFIYFWLWFHYVIIIIQDVLLPLAKVIIYKCEIFMSLHIYSFKRWNDKFSLAYFETESEKPKSLVAAYARILFYLLSLCTWVRMLHCKLHSRVVEKKKCGICRN